MPALYNRSIHHYIMLYVLGGANIPTLCQHSIHAINISLHFINTAVHYQYNIPCTFFFCINLGKKSNVSLRSVYDKIESLFLTIYRCVRKQRYSYNRWYVQIITVSSLFIVSYFTILAIKRLT